MSEWTQEKIDKLRISASGMPPRYRTPILALCYDLEQARLLNEECERQRKEAWEQVARLRAALGFFAEVGRKLSSDIDAETYPAVKHFIEAYRAMQPPEDDLDRRFTIARELGWSDIHERDGVLVGCPPASLRPSDVAIGDDIPIPPYEQQPPQEG